MAKLDKARHAREMLTYVPGTLAVPSNSGASKQVKVNKDKAGVSKKESAFSTEIIVDSDDDNDY